MNCSPVTNRAFRLFVEAIGPTRTRRDPNVRRFLHCLKTTLFDEGGAEAIFSHVRNLLMATVIIAAGTFAIRQAPDVEMFGVANEEIAGAAVAAIGFGLAGLNLIDGY
jgi:hypothetical protein